MAVSGNYEGSGLSQNTIKNVTEAKEFCFDLMKTFAGLEDSKRDAEDLVKCLEVELEVQRNLAIVYQSDNSRAVQKNVCLKNNVKTLKATNGSQKTKINALNAKIKSLEESLAMEKKEKCKNQPSDELLAKHKKLRMFVKLHLAVLQTLVKSVQSYAGKSECAPTLNKKLTSLTAGFTKRIMKIESSKQSLLQKVRENREMIFSLNKLLKTIQPRATLRCRCCGRSVTSWKKLQAHHRVVHIVQKSRKFLQQQSAAQRLKICKCIKQKVGVRNKTYRIAANTKSNMGENLQPGTLCTTSIPSTCASTNLPLFALSEIPTDMNHSSKIFKCVVNIEKTQPIPKTHTSPQSSVAKTPSISIPTQSTSQHNQLCESLSSVQRQKCFIIQSSVPATATTEVRETWQHAFSHADEPGIYNCKCGLRFESMDTVDMHARFFALGKRFPCSYCDKLFPSLAEAKTHLQKTHQEVQPKSIYMGCQSCGVIFLDSREWRKHLAAPEGKKYFGSRVCPIKFLENQNSHKFIRNPNVSQILKKPHEAVASTISNNLDPKFACRVCRKRFLYASVLSNHLLSKQNCGKFGSRMPSLRFGDVREVEMKYNPSEAKPPAQQNSSIDSQPAPSAKKSPENSSQMHAGGPVERIDEKFTFPCICGKRFSSKSSCPLHIRTKLIGKVFVCPYCPAGTVRYDLHGNLKAHIRRAHPKFAYKFDGFACNVCGKTFGRCDEAMAHKAKEHPQTK